MLELCISGKTVEIFRAKEPDSPVVYLNSYAKDGKAVYSELRRICQKPFSLVVISSLEWNRDMVPWSHPALADKAEPFLGGADDYLDVLGKEIVPQVEARIGHTGGRVIAGYSLAGLFSIYSLYRTDLFSRAVSASGSLWFPHFKEFVFSNELKANPEKIYFSIGDRESHTTNPYLRRAEDDTRAMEEYFRHKGIETCFILNKGNHYKNVVARTADAISWSIG